MSGADRASDERNEDPADADRGGSDACPDGGKTTELIRKEANSHDFFSSSRRMRSVAGHHVTPGDRIGAYEIISPLGVGGMGEVWLARHVQLDVERAIKLLDPRVSSDRHWRSRMLREARILAKLNHPNIAALYEFIDESSRSCIVLERVVGHTLSEVINQSPLPDGRALTFCRQIAEALHYAHSHEQPVVHRDLKPKNVMIRDDGVVKVLDWGIAKVLRPAKASDPNGQRAKSLRRGIAGTPGYMSPEQACGKQADRRADIWALGCVLFEMLAGEPAFPQEDLDSFLDAVMDSRGQHPDWSRLPVDLPHELEDMLRHCLERDLRHRFDRIELVLDELGAVTDVTTQDAQQSAVSRRMREKRPPRRTPSNIPPAMASFVGRERVLEQLQAKLSHSRLLTLTGPGGTGKTTLAIRLARSILQEMDAAASERFSGGVWLVELASVSDPDLVGQTIAAALPGRTAQQSGNSAMEAIAASLGERSALLIIDNCEHVCDSCRDVLTALLRRCPLAQVIATSRQALDVPGEQVYRVPPLTVPEEQHHCTTDTVAEFESVRLFVERATETRHDFALTERNAADVAKICRMLDGLPLAIELAAARTGAIAAGQLAERLSDVFAVLDRSHGREQAGAGGTGARRRALQATIGWSYNLLSETERRLFNRLSMFRGGWTLEAAEGIVVDEAHDRADALHLPDDVLRDAPIEEQAAPPLTEERMLDLLEGLVEKSLVVFEEVDGWPRYRMYETVRKYAEKLLRAEATPAEIERLRARHAQFFLQFASELKANDPGPKQAVVLERIENDHDNFRAAMEWALTQPDQPDLALELAYGLHWFYFVRGYANEGLRWLRAALAHRESKGDLLEGRAYNAAGMLVTLQYDYDGAKKFYERSLEILRMHDGQDHRVAALLNNLGMLAHTRADRHAAFDAYQEAVAIYDRLDDSVGRARVQLNLAAVNMFSDRLAEAKSLLESSLTVLSEEQDELRVAEIHQLLCEIAEREGRRDDAIAHFRQSLAMRERNREHGAILRNYFFAAVFAFDSGQYELATRLMAYISRRHESDGADIPDRHRKRMEQMLAECREKLREPSCERAWASGKGMSGAEACDLARNIV